MFSSADKKKEMSVNECKLSSNPFFATAATRTNEANIQDIQWRLNENQMSQNFFESKTQSLWQCLLSIYQN